MEENTVRGYVKSYIYRNEQNDYVIAKLETEDKEKLTIVGYFPVLNEDMMYEFKGQYVIHPSYGKQFKVISYEQVTDMSIDGLIAYLSSSYFTELDLKQPRKLLQNSRTCD